MVIKDSCVLEFKEKPQIGEGWINGGFFVLQPEITRYISSDATAWEFESLEQLASEGHQPRFLILQPRCAGLGSL